LLPPSGNYCNKFGVEGRSDLVLRPSAIDAFRAIYPSTLRFGRVVGLTTEGIAEWA
jgi:hypothetical protein